MTPSHNAQFHERHTMNVNQYFPIGFEDPDYRRHYWRGLPRSHDDSQVHHSIDHPDSMRLGSFKEHTAWWCPSASLTSGLRKAQIALSKSLLWLKIQNISCLRIHLEWIQPDQPQEDVGMFSTEWRKMLIFQHAVIKRNVSGARPVSIINLVIININKVHVNVPPSVLLNPNLNLSHWWMEKCHTEIEELIFLAVDFGKWLSYQKLWTLAA